MLVDKGFYDYDYEEPKRKRAQGPRPAMDERRLADTLKRFGVGVKAPKSMTMEELQRYAMDELKEKEPGS